MLNSGINGTVTIQKTQFKKPFAHGLSFNHAEIRLLHHDEVIPNSIHALSYGALIRMSTPIAPIMDDIQYDVYSFFVPFRLLFDQWKQLHGENLTGSGVASSVSLPYLTFYGSKINTYADDLGLAPADSNTGYSKNYKINPLHFRAIKSIYNRWFRNQNVEAPWTVYTGNANNNTYDLDKSGLVKSDGSDNTNPDFFTAYKKPDYFTSSLPYAIKGNPVPIISGVLPVVGQGTTLHDVGSDGLRFGHTGSTYSSGQSYDLTIKPTSTGGSAVLNSKSGASGVTTTVLDKTNMVADLEANVTNTINDLYYALALNKALTTDAWSGSRYWEVLFYHYGAFEEDASLQDPQLIGHHQFDINISQVLQTTGFTDPSNTSLGTPGANSVTGAKGYLFKRKFNEHGLIMTFGVARQKRHTYSCGIERAFTRFNRFDYYYPAFANMGAQKVKRSELQAWYTGSGADLLGYQEAWAEYRFRFSYNSGYLNPYRANALSYWNLADAYSNSPITLTMDFLKESRSNLIRCLVTGSSGPDYIGNFYFEDEVVNPMPLYSIPGLRSVI